LLWQRNWLLLENLKEVLGLVAQLLEVERGLGQSMVLVSVVEEVYLFCEGEGRVFVEMELVLGQFLSQYLTLLEVLGWLLRLFLGLLLLCFLINFQFEDISGPCAQEVSCCRICPLKIWLFLRLL